MSPSQGVTRSPLQPKIVTLGLKWDFQAKHLIVRAVQDAAPAARRFAWRCESVNELAPDDLDVGYTAEDGKIYIKLRDPTNDVFYPYSFILATMLHEFSHLSHLGHGKNFYRCLADAVDISVAEPSLRRDVRACVCAELLNAVCDNDQRRAKALLTVLPEAAQSRCRRPGAGCSQLPLEYAAHHGRVALTKILLKAKAQVDATCGAGSMAPLLRAAARGNKKTTMILLAARADAPSACDPTSIGTVREPTPKDVLAIATSQSSASAPSLQFLGGAGKNSLSQDHLLQEAADSLKRTRRRRKAIISSHHSASNKVSPQKSAALPSLPGLLGARQGAQIRRSITLSGSLAL
eukprot:TRINITY_DN41439_c0_g1_i1.p1 TRINITY_DN41439_c0_g1~~TRINITY_DN41439_c0_g1_i1.p1  ORF type:complete len:349 (+),score=45.19 TRINITY_DN41439_c0_g1_i1:100-1146(+)